MSFLDVTLVLTIVVAAIGFLVRHMTSDRKPACHTTSGGASVSGGGDTTNVVVGAALQRGLDRAKRRS